MKTRTIEKYGTGARGRGGESGGCDGFLSDEKQTGEQEQEIFFLKKLISPISASCERSYDSKPSRCRDCLACCCKPVAHRPPRQYFGFKIGADGELARYPKILEYFQLLAKQTDRVKFEELGKTTMGNPYRCCDDQLAGEPGEVRSARGDQPPPRRSARPVRRRGAAARRRKASRSISLRAPSTRPRSPTARRSSTSSTAWPPSNTPRSRRSSTTPSSCSCRRRIPTASTWSSTTGTRRRARRSIASIRTCTTSYVGHDDNRDWFMFTQKETRMNVEMVQNRYKPIITHDMHQQGAGGSRIFVPPFTDRSTRTSIRSCAGAGTVGQAMATALLAEGKEGVAWEDGYDMWAPARQYMVYHGQPRILTEIASGNLADPCERRRARRWGRRRRARTSRCPTEGHLDAGTAGRLRRDRRVRRHVPRREVPARVARQLLSRAPRLGRLASRRARIAFVVPADAARPLRHLRDARHPAVRRGRDPSGHRARSPPAASIRGGLVGDQDRAALRRVRQDDAREAGLSRPAAVPGRTAGAALRRHRPHAVDADRA